MVSHEKISVRLKYIFSASSDLPSQSIRQPSPLLTSAPSLSTSVSSVALRCKVALDVKCIMQSSLLFLLLISIVTCLSLNTENTYKNETERQSRDYRKYLDNEYDSYKPNRFKGRRRQKIKSTTPSYDYDGLEEAVSGSSGYEDFLKHPYVGNFGKIFNQKDINDFYLKGNNDYGKLVKGVLKETQAPESYGFVGNTDPKYPDNDYKTIVSFDKKDQHGTSYSYGDSNNFASFKSGPSNFHKDLNVDSKTSISSVAYGKLYDQFTPILNPVKSYDSYPSKSYDSYPLKNYASSFNFDTKPFQDIEPTKFTIPFGKFTVKNTDYVSEFDSKGNPISPPSSSVFDSNKEYKSPDFPKSFYDYNNSYKKPPSSSSFFDYGYNSKKPSDLSSGWNWNNKYASGYDYFGKVGGFSGFPLKSQDYSKYGFSSLKDSYQNPVRIDLYTTILI